jgi:hypothetical protein
MTATIERVYNQSSWIVDCRFPLGLAEPPSTSLLMCNDNATSVGTYVLYMRGRKFDSVVPYRFSEPGSPLAQPILIRD